MYHISAVSHFAVTAYCEQQSACCMPVVPNSALLKLVFVCLRDIPFQQLLLHVIIVLLC